MDEETRRKEVLQEEFISKVINGPRPPPKDAGNGWIEVGMPNHPAFANTKSYQKHGAFGFLICMVERRYVGADDLALFPTGRWHLSISHNLNERITASDKNTPGRYPTWDEIKEARYKFLPGDVNMAMMFPPENLYYNRHETCLHLLEVPVALALDPRQKGGL